MNAYTELAKLFNERNNNKQYGPVIGKIISLPELKIQINEKIQLNEEKVISIFNIAETKTYEERIEFVNLSKRVVLLPISDYQKFIAIGVIFE